MTLRPMRLAEVAEVMQVERAAYSHPWTEGIFLDCLRVGYCCWVCALDERPVAHGVLSVAAGEAHLLNICVHPDWQGRGVGRRLLHRLLRLAAEHQADTVFLEVRVSNRAAIALYRTAGFNEVGLRRDYYPAPTGREDAIVFARTLGY